MKSLPTMEEYNQAVQSPKLAFTDPELASGKLKTNVLGLPAVMSGGFTLTYAVTCGRKKYAVRCLHQEIPHLIERYHALSDRLNSLNSSYFVDFEFQEHGIRIGGKAFPIIKMAWADGQSLGSFVEDNYSNPEALANLDQSLASLSEFLESNLIAHGDIQPGNIIVGNEGKKIQLIDYDGIYFDNIRSLGPVDIGNINFQHPDRMQEDWNVNIDRFSFIQLHLVLSVLREEPDFWLSTHSDGDIFLFTANDYARPASSPILNSLLLNEKLSPLVQSFIRICEGEFEAIPGLVAFATGNIVLLPIGASRESPEEAAYLANYPVVSALDYQKCKKMAGKLVELVGKVVDIKRGYTRYKTPYAFVNFSDWRGEAVKVTFWQEALARNTISLEELQGKYISVVGLLQPPFSKGNYTHISIEMQESTIIRLISENEAQYRLAAKEPRKVKHCRSKKASGVEAAASRKNNLQETRVFGKGNSIRDSRVSGVTTSRTGVQTDSLCMEMLKEAYTQARASSPSASNTGWTSTVGRSGKNQPGGNSAAFAQFTAGAGSSGTGVRGSGAFGQSNAALQNQLDKLYQIMQPRQPVKRSMADWLVFLGIGILFVLLIFVFS